MSTIEKAHFIDSENCQGTPQKYWRSWGQASNGAWFAGIGATAEQAEQDAKEALAASRIQYGRWV